MGLFNWTTRKPTTFQSTAGVTVHVSDTGRVWVDPREVVKTPEFQAQVAAVRRLRLAREAALPRR